MTCRKALLFRARLPDPAALSQEPFDCFFFFRKYFQIKPAVLGDDDIGIGRVELFGSVDLGDLQFPACDVGPAVDAVVAFGKHRRLKACEAGRIEKQTLHIVFDALVQGRFDHFEGCFKRNHSLGPINSIVFFHHQKCWHAGRNVCGNCDILPDPNGVFNLFTDLTQDGRPNC